MKRVAALALVVLAAAIVSEVAATIPRDTAMPQGDGFPLIFYLEVGIVLLGGVSALAFLVWQPGNAPGMLGVGLYTLIMGIVFFTAFPIWLSGDWILDGALVLAAILAALGLALVLASGAILSSHTPARALTLGLAGGPAMLALGWVAAFIGARAGVRHVGVSPALLLCALALLVLGGLLASLGPRRGVAVLPMLLACGGAAFTIALLLARGPGDWASGAPSLHLYSFPIAMIGKAISLAIVHITGHAQPAAPPQRPQVRDARAGDVGR